VSEILLEVTPDHQIARIVIQEVDGASTEYRFGEMKEDLVIGDGRFEFKPPAGTETVEGDWNNRESGSIRQEADSSRRSE